MEYQERIDVFLEKGWRISETGDNWSLLLKGEKTPHLAHIFISIITFGIWGLVYGPILLFGGLKKRRITCNRRGKGIVSWVN